MQTALILMTILGCDDSATQCHYVEMLDERWATIQDCDASSEDKLKTYSNLEYPVVVAVCQTPEDTGLAEVAAEQPDLAEPTSATAVAAPEVPGDLVPKVDIPAPAVAATAPAGSEDGLAARVLQRFRDALPEADSLKAIVSEPVHVVSDGYSWVAKRFDK